MFNGLAMQRDAADDERDTRERARRRDLRQHDHADDPAIAGSSDTIRA